MFNFNSLQQKYSKLRGLKSANAHEAHTRIIVWLDVKINFEFKKGVWIAIKSKKR